MGLADIVFFVLGSILTLEEGIILSTKDAETYPRCKFFVTMENSIQNFINFNRNERKLSKQIITGSDFTNATDFIAGIFDLLGIIASLLLVIGTALVCNFYIFS